MSKEDEDTEVLLGVVPKDSALTTGLIPIGEYDLRFAKSGHDDKSKEHAVLAGKPTPVAETMEKRKGLMWWVYRVGGGAVAVVAGVLALGSGGEDTPIKPPPPLPDPPDPPAN
jgi:hypothetical protein